MRGNLVLINSMCISSEITEEFQLFACEEKFSVLTDPNIPKEIFVLRKDTNIKKLKRISENKNIYFYSLLHMPDILRLYFLNGIHNSALYSVMDNLINNRTDSPQDVLLAQLYLGFIPNIKNVLADEKSTLERFRNRSKN